MSHRTDLLTLFFLEFSIVFVTIQSMKQLDTMWYYLINTQYQIELC